MPMYLMVFDDGSTYQTRELEDAAFEAISEGALRVFRFEDEAFYEFTIDGAWQGVPEE